MKHVAGHFLFQVLSKLVLIPYPLMWVRQACGVVAAACTALVPAGCMCNSMHINSVSNKDLLPSAAAVTSGIGWTAEDGSAAES